MHKIGIPSLIRLWFGVDFILALTPYYWTVAQQSRIGGVPTSLVYLFATGVFIAVSIVWAYVAGRQVTTERR